jgi:DNA-damage-inducible protein J
MRFYMPKKAVIQTRIDSGIKEEAMEILSQLNITMSEAISLYLAQITLHKGIPFEIKIPNDLTAHALKDSEDGKSLHKAKNVDDLFERLES